MEMQFANLGRTGLKVSRLCLGTMNFGDVTSEADSHAIMDRALELGINFVDTANRYGNPKGEGITESLIGGWLAQGGRRREQIVLATKLRNPMGPGVNDRGLSAYHIRSECESSLRRLRTDHVDLYQMHHVEREAPWEEIWQAMQILVQQGKVLYVGSSNFAGWHIAQAQGEARARHFMGLVCEQSVYNLSNRMVELEVLPACRAFGLGFVAYSPLGGGLLGGVLSKEREGRRASPGMQETVDRRRSQLETWEGLCSELGEQPADVALAWLLHNPVLTAPIVGPRTIAQLEGALHALSITLDDELLQKLDAIWPGPGGEAPEAYAW
jgi:aryl-alcohol dehydrogenase-like predicted oxidoreductase